MATSASARLFLAIAIMANFCTCFHVPRALLSHNDNFLNSVLSVNSFTSGINFCTLKNGNCSSELNGFKPFAAVYEAYEGIDDNSSVNMNGSFSFFRQSILKPGYKFSVSNSQNQFPEQARLPIQTVESGYEDRELQHYFYKDFVTPANKQTFLPWGTLIKEETIRSLLCNSPAMGSEFRSCPESVQEMIGFSKTVFGANNNLVVLITKSTKFTGAGKKELMIGNIKKLNVDKMVSCHGLLLDSNAIYFCHSMSGTQVYVVDVIDPRTIAKVNTVLAACHMDTSTWTEEHVAFKILNSFPGKIEVCHWNTDLDLFWFGN